ncbi:MAG TPA: GNAT family N-acetyltransferase, partial [Pilimelia sp.]|nr:GNAT family N-acetyltransferase [Pilimelia sp.]
MDVDVTENPDLHRFEIRLDGELAGFVAYRPVNGALAFTHAEVDPARRGAGVAARLVAGAFELVRAAGGRVRP